MRKEVTYFNTTSEEYLQEYEKITPPGHSFRARKEKVLELIPEVKTSKKALDVGCGPGLMTEGLLKKGYTVTCTDAAPDMVSLARKAFPSLPETNFVVGDVYKLPFPDKSFDLVISMGLMEYLDDQAKAIQELKRVTNEGGTLIITFPYKWSPWRTWNRIGVALIKPLRKILGRTSNNWLTHREYTPKIVHDLLRPENLKITKTQFYNFKLIPYPFDKIFPRFTVWQSRLCEKLDRTPLYFLGTGFIVVVQRKSVLEK